MLERQEDHESNISFQMPSREQHEAFISRSPFAHWLLVKDGDMSVGYVSVGWDNAIGVSLFRAYRGQGYGRAALEKLLRIANPLPASPGERPGYFIANINPSNERSIHLFQSLGFELIQHTFALKEEK